MAELLAQTAERFRAAAAGQGIEIVPLATPPGLTFMADRLAVDRILGNLIGNAEAAFAAAADTAPGQRPVGGRHIWLAARAVSGTPAGDAVALEVTDDGPGFPPGATGRVFERFYRADPSRARAGGGSGLGLTIVRELARAHGGEALAENVAPHGARVSVILPLVPTPSAVRFFLKFVFFCVMPRPSARRPGPTRAARARATRGARATGARRRGWRAAPGATGARRPGNLSDSVPDDPGWRVVTATAPRGRSLFFAHPSERPGRWAVGREGLPRQMCDRSPARQSACSVRGTD